MSPTIIYSQKNKQNKQLSPLVPRSAERSEVRSGMKNTSKISAMTALASLLMAVPLSVAALGASDFPEPNLGERVDSPYKPYTFRAGEYGPQDYDGFEAWDPEWLRRKLRFRPDYRQDPTFMPGTIYYDHNCPCWRVSGYSGQHFKTVGPIGSQFYQKAMSRSADAFADPGVRTYSNYQYRFENQLRSIR